jgi:hypothetical protein
LIGRRARLSRLPGLGLRMVQVARRVGRHQADRTRVTRSQAPQSRVMTWPRRSPYGRSRSTGTNGGELPLGDSLVLAMVF